MCRRVLAFLIVLCVGPVVMSGGARGATAVPAAGRYLVVVKDGASPADVVAAVQRLGATVDRFFATMRTAVVSLPDEGVAALRGDPRVAYVAPDRIVHILATAVPALGRPWPTGVARIGVTPLSDHQSAAGGSTPAARRTAVALLDTGVMPRSDLNVVGGVDCSAGSSDDGGRGGDGTTADRNGHGTHVAGIVGDQGPPGVVGVSPGTPLYAVRVFGADGSGPISDVICGLDWVAAHAAAAHIKVANLSLGGPGSDDGQCGRTDHDPFHAAICRVTAAGVTVVAAAGNDGDDMANSTPAAYREVLAVTAMADFDGRPGGLGSPPLDCATSDRDDVVAHYSDYAVPGSANEAHTIAAPGDCITAAWNDGRTKTLSGTSMAAPHVAGLVARCIDAGRCAGLSPAEIIARLRSDGAGRPAAEGFRGDPNQALPGKYFGYLATDTGY